MILTILTEHRTQLPPEFKHFTSQHIGGKGPKPALFAHCRRELFHEQVKILLDDEFVEAYEHGIVIMCWDGIRCHFYPRIFTYSADYPEKWVIAAILMLGIISNLMVCSG